MARSADEGEAVALELGEQGLALSGDVTDGVTCAGIVAALTASFDPSSVLVNAAGISPIRGRAERQHV